MSKLTQNIETLKSARYNYFYEENSYSPIFNEWSKNFIGSLSTKSKPSDLSKKQKSIVAELIERLEFCNKSSDKNKEEFCNKTGFSNEN
jgi:hypothetical protein